MSGYSTLPPGRMPTHAHTTYRASEIYGRGRHISLATAEFHGRLLTKRKCLSSRW